MSNDGGGIGTSMGGLEFSPERKKRNAERRKRQERYWASRSGEVQVSRIEPAPSTVEQAAGEDD
jgi:hypothetical protein